MLVQTDGTTTTVKSVAVVKPHISTRGTLTRVDAETILKYILGAISFTKADLTNADYKKDSTIDIKDVIALLKA
jgi:hypothetical protein